MFVVDGKADRRQVALGRPRRRHARRAGRPGRAREELRQAGPARGGAAGHPPGARRLLRLAPSVLRHRRSPRGMSSASTVRADAAARRARSAARRSCSAPARRCSTSARSSSGPSWRARSRRSAVAGRRRSTRGRRRSGIVATVAGARRHPYSRGSGAATSRCGATPSSGSFRGTRRVDRAGAGGRAHRARDAADPRRAAVADAARARLVGDRPRHRRGAQARVRRSRALARRSGVHQGARAEADLARRTPRRSPAASATTRCCRRRRTATRIWRGRPRRRTTTARRTCASPTARATWWR